MSDLNNPVKYIFKCLVCGYEEISETRGKCSRCGGQIVLKTNYYDIMQTQREEEKTELNEKEELDEKEDDEEE